MASYRVIAASVNIHAGVLGLEPHQARARLHRLKPRGGNRYEVTDPPVSFKRGEEFEYEGELPKDLVESLAPFPVIDPDLVTELVAGLVLDDGVAEPPPDQSHELFEQDPVTDLVEDGPDDGAPEMPAGGGKKRPRRKPAA